MAQPQHSTASYDQCRRCEAARGHRNTIERCRTQAGGALVTGRPSLYQDAVAEAAAPSLPRPRQARSFPAYNHTLHPAANTYNTNVSYAPNTQTVRADGHRTPSAFLSVPGVHANQHYQNEALMQDSDLSDCEPHPTPAIIDGHKQVFDRGQQRPKRPTKESVMMSRVEHTSPIARCNGRDSRRPRSSAQFPDTHGIPGSPMSRKAAVHQPHPSADFIIPMPPDPEYDHLPDNSKSEGHDGTSPYQHVQTRCHRSRTDSLTGSISPKGRHSPSPSPTSPYITGGTVETHYREPLSSRSGSRNHPLLPLHNEPSSTAYTTSISLQASRPNPTQVPQLRGRDPSDTPLPTHPIRSNCLHAISSPFWRLLTSLTTLSWLNALLISLSLLALGCALLLGVLEDQKAAVKSPFPPWFRSNVVFNLAEALNLLLGVLLAVPYLRYRNRGGNLTIALGCSALVFVSAPAAVAVAVRSQNWGSFVLGIGARALSAVIYVGMFVGREVVESGRVRDEERIGWEL